MDGQGCHTAACTFFKMLMDEGLPLILPNTHQNKNRNTHLTNSHPMLSALYKQLGTVTLFNVTVQLRKSIRHGRTLRSYTLVKEEININSSIMTSFIIHFKAPVFKIVDGAGRSCNRTWNACLNQLFSFQNWSGWTKGHTEMYHECSFSLEWKQGRTVLLGTAMAALISQDEDRVCMFDVRWSFHKLYLSVAIHREIVSAAWELAWSRQILLKARNKCPHLIIIVYFQMM